MPPDTLAHVLYLASASPRRASLIKLLGVRQVIIKPADVNETVNGNLSPKDVASSLALKKAKATAAEIVNEERGVVLGADTIVVINDKILGKPNDENEATSMLMTLSNNTHTVYTGVALINLENGVMKQFVEATQVTFRKLDADEITRYVTGGSPMDKAGAYGIQDDHGAVFISRIEGDYYNVVGLPLCSTYVHLKDFAPTLFA
ncbi:MAG TPA: Maf family protein [Candidatus Kapabacteria bacterium]|nr:Maf family protein [Candidatus Kapabacteria bacterium]